MLTAAWASVAGCSAPALPAPAESCAEAYDAIAADVAAMTSGAGGHPPDRAAFVARCDALELSAEALGCLAPAYAAAAPDTCVAATAPHRAAIDGLAAWYADAAGLAPTLPPADAPNPEEPL